MVNSNEPVKECPRDAYPLTADGFCERCQEKPTFPPRRVRYNRREGGIGAGYYSNVIEVKRYEFEDQWQDKVASQKEVSDLTYQLASDTVAKLHHRQSWDEYVENLKKNNDDGTFRQLVKQAEEISNAAFEALAESDDVEKVSVIPTAWEEYSEAQSFMSSTIRLSEGVYFGLTDTATAAFSAVFGFIAIMHPSSWMVLAQKAGGVGLAIKKLFKVYYRLAGDQKTVFEAIHKFSCEARRINYDADPHSSEAYGSRGPTLMEIQDMVSGELSSEKVRDALAALKDKGVIDKNDRSMWHIRF